MKHTISVIVENKSGVLTRITGLFSRRGYNIHSLAVGTTENPGISRMTIVVEGEPAIVEQVTKQLYKLIDVVKLYDHTNESRVERELVLIKVQSSPKTRTEILQVAEIFRAHVVDLSKDSFIIEVTGNSQKINALIEALSEYGILELARTGKLALSREKK